MIVAIFLSLLLAAGLLAVLYRLGKRSRLDVTESHTHPQGFSPALYEPMLRLLDPEEFAFIRSQRGYTPEIGRTFRRQRYQVLRLYLKSLDNDFRLLDHAAHVLLVHSTVDRSELARALAKQRFVFYRRMFVTKCASRAYAWGWDAMPAAGTMDACEAFWKLVLELRDGSAVQALA